MKQFIALIIITSLALTSCNNTKKIKGFGIKEMTAQEFKKHHDNGSIKVIDVRTPGEFKRGHIEGAININVSNPSFQSQLEKLDKNGLYLMHCQVGGRSKGAFKTFQSMGFKNVGHLTKGLVDWQRAGYGVVK